MKKTQDSKTTKESISKQIKESSDKLKSSIKEQELLHLNLGYILGLFSNSGYHHKLSIAQFMSSVIPAIKNNQFKIFFKGFRPVAFVSWALLSQETAEKFKTGNYYLNLDDWKSGEELWLGELIAPYSDNDRSAVITNLKEKIFVDKTINILLRNQDGSVKEIIQNFEETK